MASGERRVAGFHRAVEAVEGGVLSAGDLGGEHLLPRAAGAIG